MKQIRLSQEELCLIFLKAGLIVGEEVISNIEIGKSGAVIFTVIDDIESKLLNLPITDIGLSKQTTHPLWKSGKFKILDDIVKSKESELLRVLNFGPTCMKELKIFLIQNGFELKEE